MAVTRRGPRTVGYDVGGAHLKVAVAEAGRIVAVRQIPCRLWQGIGELDVAFSTAEDMASGARCHAVTMTAELTEIFESRSAGVGELVSRTAGRLGPDTRFFMGLKGFGGAEDARGNPDLVGSANFLATALCVSKLKPNALLIDMGSTTTDIVVCDRPQGLNDAERLQTGELVYTGFTRTPVASITTRAPLAGQWQTLARDAFATMADVRRILATLPEDVDGHATADGRGKSVAESLMRFARGFGRDGDMRHLAAWQRSAAYIEDCQLRSVHDGAAQLLSRSGADVSDVVCAGIGAQAAAEIARRLGLPALMFGDLLDADDVCRLWATRCAPAAAVALLADAALGQK